jgi:hypothetical protein
MKSPMLTTPRLNKRSTSSSLPLTTDLGPIRVGETLFKAFSKRGKTSEIRTTINMTKKEKETKLKGVFLARSILQTVSLFSTHIIIQIY